MKHPQFVMIPHADVNSQIHTIVGFDGLVSRSTEAYERGKDNLLVKRPVNNIQRNYEGNVVSYLSEKASVNEVKNSSDFSDSIYTITGQSVISTNVAASPVGNLEADSLSSTDDQFTEKSIEFQQTLSNGSPYVFSIYLKDNGVSHAQVGIYKASAPYDIYANAVFSLEDLKINYDLHSTRENFLQSKIEDVGNGWRRVSVVSLGNSAENVNISIGFADANELGDHQNPRTIGKISLGTDAKLLMWGAQLEEGFRATSLIDTVSTAVSRDCLNYSIGMTNTFLNSTFSEGSFYLDIKPYFTKSANSNVGFTNSSGTNRIMFSSTNYEDQAVMTVVKDGVFHSHTLNSFTYGERIRLMVTVSQYSVSFYLNGDRVEGYSWLYPISEPDFTDGLTQFRNRLFSDNDSYEGLIYDVRAYPMSLTRSEAEELTKI
jgi:hypothetical protein